MKRMLFILFLMGQLLLALDAYAEADLTLLVYLCGSGLQEAACEDIYEMGIAETGDHVNTVILAGGCSEWDFEEIEGNTRNLITLRDGYFESITDWEWASMGSEESLLEFLEYGLTMYPAKRTAVVLWDHGAGSEAGLCFDDTTEDQDGLSLLEINNVLYDLDKDLGGFHIDLFGCDACMMATYEMAAMLSYYSIDYFIASEETEPDIGWAYTAWLESFARHPEMTTETLCNRIIDSFMEAGLKEDPDDVLTMSAISLKDMDPLQEAMEVFGGILQSELKQGNVAEVSRGRSQMYTFGSFWDASWDMVDLGAMLDVYAKFDERKAADARRALSRAVIASRQTANLNPCSGLSVLIPQNTKNEFMSYYDGVDLSFYMPNWIGFVKMYAGQVTEGSHTFAQTTPQVVTGTGFFSQLASHLPDSPSALNWNSATETYEETAPTTPAPAIATTGKNEYAFSAVISKEDLKYLDYVEGMLMMDLSDEEMFGYLDLGLMQNNVINWDTGEIYSLFDGTWPILHDQLVPMYDQISNAYGRRSLIPVKLNGEYTYLVVEIKAGETEGRILGTNAGYDDNGLPIRNTTKLKKGDRIVPVYTMYYSFDDEDEDEELSDTEFDGDEIIWEDGLRVTFEDLSDEEDEKLEMMFCFVLNDVFGGYDMTDPISFEI